MKINVSTAGDILVDDKVMAIEEVSRNIELLKMAFADSEKIKKLCKEIETIRKDYNGKGKDTIVVKEEE
jgi:hypothetical protein